MRRARMRIISAVLSACMMLTAFPVSAIAAGGGGYDGPESSVSEQTEDNILSKNGQTITAGGEYVMKGGDYSGTIVVNAPNEDVTIRIDGDINFIVGTKILFNVLNVGTLTIENDEHTVTELNHHILDTNGPGKVVMNGGTYKTTLRNLIMLFGSNNELVLNHVTAEVDEGYIVTTQSTSKVIVNGGKYIQTGNANVCVFQNTGHMTLTDAVVEPKNKAVVNSGTLEIYGGSYKTVDQNCIVNNGGLVTIDKGTATEGLLEAEGASCIKNNWGRVTIKGGTITSDAEMAVENNGGLRMSGGTVTAPQGTAILFTNISGDAQITGGSIINSVNGIWLQDIGESEVTLKNVTFSGNQNDIHLGAGQKINIKKSFTGCATVLVDDPAEGRQITLESEDVSYQKQLNLTSNNEGYRVGYKKENDQEYRMLTTRIGNAVTAVDAVATAEINGEVKELDSMTPVPAGTTVTIKANKAPDGMVFDQWTATPADVLGDTAFAWKEENTTFVMPDHEITLAAQYRSAEIEDDSDWVGTALIAATVAVGGAVLLYQGHELGTEAYLNHVLPYGEAIPNNRIQLAELLWRDAKCPEAVSTENYRDIDSDSEKEQKAAHWAVESGLVKLQDEETYPNCFDPNAPVTKVDVIRAWKKAQELKETAQ